MCIGIVYGVKKKICKTKNQQQYQPCWPAQYNNYLTECGNAGSGSLINLLVLYVYKNIYYIWLISIIKSAYSK